MMMSNSGRVPRGKDLWRMRSRQSKKGSTSETKSTSVPKRRTTQEITSKNIPNKEGFLTSDYEDNRDSRSRSSSESSSSSGSSSNSSSEGSVSPDEESGNEDALRTIKETPGIFCDWYSVHCVRTGPGYENLELRRCQHPGGKCNRLVHHICAINRGQSKVFQMTLGTHAGSTPPLTLQDQDKLTLSQKHLKVVPTILTTTRMKTKMKKLSR